MAGNTISDINVNITATNKDLKNKLEESRLELHKQAKSYASVGRSIVQGINDPIAKATIKNKEFQGTLMNTGASLERVVDISESLYVAYNSLTPQIGKTIVAYKALSIAQKATIIGGVVAGVGLAIAAYKQLNKVLNKNSEYQRQIIEVNTNAKKSIIEEKFEVERLMKKAIDLNSTMAQKKEAIEKLNKISPEYLGNLDAEKSSTTQIVEAVDNYTSSLLSNAKAKAASSQIFKLAEQEIDIEQRRLELKEKIERLDIREKQREKTSGNVTGGPSSELALARQQLNALNMEHVEVVVQMNKIEKIYDANIHTEKKFTEGVKETTHATKEKKEQFKGLTNTLADYYALGSKIAAFEQKTQLDVQQRLTANLALYKLDNDARKLRSNSMSIVQSKIRQLIDKGYTPESEAVQTLIKQYERLNQASSLSVIRLNKPQTFKGKDSSGNRAAEMMNGLKITRSYHEGIRGFFEENKHGLENLTAGLEMASNLAGNLSDIVNNFYEKRKQETQSFYDKEIALIERSKMSEEQKAKKIAQLEEEKDKKLRKIQREQAIRAKRLAIFQATLNAALAVTQALATGNYAAAIAAGIYGAAQVGVIASEPVPALAKGGIATGPTLAMVGDNSDVKTNPEVIAPIKDLKKMIGENSYNINLTGGMRISSYEMKMFLERGEVSRSRMTA